MSIHVSALQVNLVRPTPRRFYLHMDLILRGADVHPPLPQGRSVFKGVGGSEPSRSSQFHAGLAAAARSCFPSPSFQLTVLSEIKGRKQKSFYRLRQETATCQGFFLLHLRLLDPLPRADRHFLLHLCANPLAAIERECLEAYFLLHECGPLAASSMSIVMFLLSHLILKDLSGLFEVLRYSCFKYNV